MAGAGPGIRFSLRSKLILFFLVVSVIPLVAVNMLVLTRMGGALREQMSNKLIAVRDLKARQIEEYFQSVARDIVLEAESPTVARAVQEFGATQDVYTIRRLGYLGNPDLVHSGKGDPYDVVHARYFNVFGAIVTTKGYYDIYLVAPNGDVVYNYDKGDDFATNLLSGSYRNTSIADLFRQLQTNVNSHEVRTTDFIPYGPSGGVPASFVGAPIVENGQNVGVLIYQLPLDQINALLQDHTGMGETGETYLVGPDKLMRSDSRFTEESTVLAQEVDTPAVQKALAGTIGVQEMEGYRGIPVLSAYKPIDIGGLKWALLTEVDAAEFFAVSNRLRNLVIGIVAVAALAVAGLGIAISRSILRPIGQLTVSAQRIGAGDLEVEIAIPPQNDEVGLLARAFRQMQAELKKLYAGLEQQVAERTAELERRAAQLRTAAEVGRAAVSILDTERLIWQAVELIRERFDLYYVGLFRVEGEWAVLRAGTGAAGQVMLARGHRIKVGEGMIGWSVAHAQPRVALEAGADAVRLATAELPHTRSEAALPLRSRGQVIGALTVQSDRPGVFDTDTITVLQAMADQVAVALDNARLFAASQEALEAERRAYGEVSRQAWGQMLRARHELRYVCDSQDTVRPIAGQPQPEMVQAVQEGHAVQVGQSALAMPLKVRDQVLGAIRLRKRDEVGAWTEEEVRLMETIADQLGLALESARLHQDTQRRAARERLAGEITTRMRETLDIDTVLQTAIREIGEALGMAEVEVRMLGGPAGEPQAGLAPIGGNGYSEGADGASNLSQEVLR
jgi:GAF domain-containing protein